MILDPVGEDSPLAPCLDLDGGTDDDEDDEDEDEDEEGELGEDDEEETETWQVPGTPARR
jgi:hypothetical protein